MKCYHCTTQGIYSTLKPSIPNNEYTKYGLIETKTPRISVAQTLFQCLLSPIMSNIEKKTQLKEGYRSYLDSNSARIGELEYFKNYKFQHYILMYEINIPDDDPFIYYPTADEVFDIESSDEIWIKRELRFPEINLLCIFRKVYPLFIEPVPFIEIPLEAQYSFKLPQEMVYANDFMYEKDNIEYQETKDDFIKMIDKIYINETNSGFKLIKS